MAIKEGRHEKATAFLFISPFMFGLLVFIVLPVIFSFMMSFQNLNSLANFRNPRFVGFKNYLYVLKNERILLSFFRSLQYSLIFTTTILVCSFFIALGLNEKLKFNALSRTLILLPYVSNVMAIAIVWMVILHPSYGPLNNFLNIFFKKTEEIRWLMDEYLALPTVAIIGVWMNLAFQTIVFLAALQEIPTEILESAKIDGVGAIRKLLHIIIPCISPTLFFLLISSFIGSTQNFSIVKAITNGGPGYSSEVVAVSIYKHAFEFNKYSIATAEAFVLFSILLLFTIIQWRLQKKWVQY